MSTKEVKPEKKICAAYIRVSTHDQEEYSPDSQIKVLREYAEKNNMLLPDKFIFRDDGISGRNARKRSAFQEMIATAKSEPHPFDVLLLWKFSRFARNQEESIVYKSMLRKKCGIDVVSVTEPIMEGPFGQLIERIIEWQDEYYSINLGTEVRRGMTERANRGLHNSIAPFGYIYQLKALNHPEMDPASTEKEMVIDPAEAEIVRKIYKDFLDGTGILAIAKQLNAAGIRTKHGKPWANRTVRYILTNPIYIGKIRWCPDGVNNYHKSDWRESTILMDGAHEPLITKEVFTMAQEKIQEYTRLYKGSAAKTQRQDSSHMLQGLIKCSSCGATLSRTSGYLNCSGYTHGKCTESHAVPIGKLEDMVLVAVRTQLESMNFELTRRDTPSPAGSTQLRQSLAREEEILKRHKAAYAAGIDSMEEYRINKQACEMRIRRLKAELSAEPPAPKISKKEFARRSLDLLDSMEKNASTAQEKNAMLRSFIDHIVFSRDPLSLEIVFYI